MSAAAHPHQASVAGFTLVEALVAMALMGLVLTGLAMVTSQWLPNWQRGLARVQSSELVALAIDRIVADLASAEFVPPNRATKKPLFEGSELAVTFVRSALGPNAAPGLEIVQLAEARELKGPALARSTARFAPRAPDAAAPRFGEPIVLLKPPYRASFSYAGRDGVWRADWIDADELPRAVRLVVRDTATGRALGASTATMIHTELPVECITEQTRRGCGADKGAPKDGETTPEEAPQ
jgi:general secretion pathway protein J